MLKFSILIKGCLHSLDWTTGLIFMHFTHGHSIFRLLQVYKEYILGGDVHFKNVDIRYCSNATLHSLEIFCRVTSVCRADLILYINGL